MADYDLNEIADALSAAVQGLDAYVISGVQQEVTATGDVPGRVKDALEANETLGGLVSYAVATGTRTIGNINYGGVDYQGATIVIEVVAQ
jgi:hypothetical protein